MFNLRRPLSLLLLVVVAAPLYAISPKDSLHRALAQAKDDHARVRIFRNLADLTIHTPDNLKYLEHMAESAEGCSDTESLLEALSDMAIYCIEEATVDSARYYLQQIEAQAPAGQVDRWGCYISMLIFNKEVNHGDAQRTLAKKLEQSGEDKNKNIYRQIEQAYVMIVGLEAVGKGAEMLPYAKTAADLAAQLPFKDGCAYRTIVMRMQARALAFERRHVESHEVYESVVELNERYVATYCAAREFFPMNEFYIRNYASMMINLRGMTPQKAAFYKGKLDELSRIATRKEDRYSCFLGLNNYYLVNKHYDLALASNDSLIKLAYDIAQYNVSGLYKVNSIICEHLGRSGDALRYLKMAIAAKDSLEIQKAQEQLTQLQVDYDVNKLNYEKSQLELRNKRMMVITLVIVLMLSIGVSIYIYHNLRRERELQRKVSRLNLLAQQSEKMKSAFLDSVCHEIRTPLNAIVGFSDMLCDYPDDPESAQAFRGEIQSNSRLLTSLVDSMLEASRLDVSDEKLQCEPSDVVQLIYNCIGQVEHAIQAKGLELVCDLGPGPIIMPTNDHYFSLVARNLLSNAVKFTDKGCVTISCGIVQGKHFVMAVQDTGCGIPEQMHNSIFERFSKLDINKQGAGLGLYLCRVVVTRLLGKIYIDPAYSGGTRVVVELPID